MRRCIYYIAATLLSLELFLIPAVAQKRRQKVKDYQAQVVAAFGIQCSTSNFPVKKLQRLIRPLAKKYEDSKTALGNGKTAVGYDLNGDGVKEYFVLLGDVGIGDNGYWGIFSVKPVRLLGILPAENIYLRKRVNGWASITTSWHESVSDAFITTYGFRNGQYVRVAGGYQVSASRNDEPKFFGRTAELYLCDRE